MHYKELKKKQRYRVESFPYFIALTVSQLNSEIKKRNWIEDDVCSVGFGCYTLKERKNDFIKMLEDNRKERVDFAKDFDNLVDMIIYEMNEMNYGNTFDEEGTTENILWNIDEDIQKLDRFDEAWIKAEEIVKGKVN